MAFDYPVFPIVQIGSGSQDVLDAVTEGIVATLPVDPEYGVETQIWGEPSHGVPPNILAIEAINLSYHFGSIATVPQLMSRLPRIMESPPYKERLVSMRFPFLRADLYFPEYCTQEDRDEFHGDVVSVLVASQLSKYTLRLDGTKPIVPSEPTLIISEFGRGAKGIEEISDLLLSFREDKVA